MLDSNIRSTTEFKQIIGRGTRIREDFGKMFFTIFDFRDVTRLFHDEDFDGAIEQVENFNSKIDKEIEPPPELKPKTAGEKQYKYFISGEPVEIIHEQIQYRDKDGKLTTKNLIDYTKNNFTYKSLNDFLTAWNAADRKKAVIDEMEKQGIFFKELQKIVGKNLDPFDLILHIVFDKPPLTRKERAEKVRKKNYFTKYGEQAAKILDALLDKYAEIGIAEVENPEVLKVSPLNEHGTPAYIVHKIFGSKEKYLSAIRELENALYAA